MNQAAITRTAVGLRAIQKMTQTIDHIGVGYRGRAARGKSTACASVIIGPELPGTDGRV